MFDVFSKVTGGDSEESLPDASNDGSEGAAATKGTEGARPADCTPADFRERAAALADRSDVPELDFSEAALPDVDAMATGTHPVGDELAYGSYLGETLVREYGGEWVRDDGWGVRVALGDGETTVAVFDAARMALGGTPVFEGVAERLHDQGDPYAEGTGESTAAADATASEGDATATEDDATAADHEVSDEGLDEPDATDEAESEVVVATEPEVAEEQGESDAPGGTEPDDPAAVDDEGDAGDIAAPESADSADSTPLDATETASDATGSEDDSSENEDVTPAGEGESAAEAAGPEGDSAGDDAEFGDESETAADAPTTSPGPSAETTESEGTTDVDEAAGDESEGDDETVTPEDHTPAPAADETSVSAATEADDPAVERDDGPDGIRSEATADAVDADPADRLLDSEGTPAASDEEDDGADPTAVGSADATEEDTADPVSEDPADRTAGAAEVEAKGDDDVDGTEAAETDGPRAATEDDEADDGSIVDARSSELGLGDDGPTEGDFSRYPLAGRERDDVEADDGDGRDAEVSPFDGTDDGDGDDTAGDGGEVTPVDDSDGATVSGPDGGAAGGIDRDVRVESEDEATADPGTESRQVERVEYSETESTEYGGDAVTDETRDNAATEDDDPAGERDGEPATDEDEREDAVGESAVGENVPTQSPTASSTVEDGSEIRDGPDEDEVIDADGADAEIDDGADVAVEEGDVAGETPADDAADASDDVGASDDLGATGGSGPSRDDYEAPAIEFRNAWSERDFDFTPGSLARLDSFLDDQWDGRFRRGSLDGAPTDPEEGSGPLLRVGAYVGEVLVQGYDGEWVAGEDGDPAIAVPGRHGRREAFPVFDVVRTSLVENARVAYAVDAMANRLDLEIHASGAEDTGFALGEASPGTAASSADVITTILDRAEAFVAAWPGYDLDYRPASLVRLDNLVERELDSEAFRAATLGERTDADALRLADRAAGASAYFAAVLVRHLDAQWEIGAEVALAVEGPAGQTRIRPFDGSVACLRGEDSFMRRYDRVHDAVERESRTPE